MRMQANLNIGERFNGRGIIYVKRAIAQEVGISIAIVLVREHGVACPGPGGEPLYKMAALSVASRRLPRTSQRNVLPIATILLWGYHGHRTAARTDVPGSRLLLTDRAAMLQSGSPPGVWATRPAARLQFSVFLPDPSSVLAFELLVLVPLFDVAGSTAEKTRNCC